MLVFLRSRWWQVFLILYLYQYDSANTFTALLLLFYQIGKWQSMESEEVVSQELVDMVDQMKGMLVQVAHSSESSPKEPSAPTSLPPPPPPPPSAPPLTSQRSTGQPR